MYNYTIYTKQRRCKQSKLISYSYSHGCRHAVHHQVLFQFTEHFSVDCRTDGAKILHSLIVLTDL